jgi:raffinose/stachyose/melibiose transport system permease protein
MRASRRLAAEAVALVLATVFFLVPFALMLLTAVKDPVQALDLDFAWPVNWRLVENFTEVIEARDYVLLRAYVNSTVLTVTG